MSRPRVSTMRCRLRPLTFLWASLPRSPPASVVLTLWVSMIPAVGRGFLPAFLPGLVYRTWLSLPPRAARARAADWGGEGARGGEVGGKLPPLAAGAQDVEDGIQDVPPVHGGRAADLPGLGEQGPQEIPLAVGQVARIACTFAHTPL